MPKTATQGSIRTPPAGTRSVPALRLVPAERSCSRRSARTGSYLRWHARMGMSYRRAWLLVEAVNAAFVTRSFATIPAVAVVAVRNLPISVLKCAALSEGWNSSPAQAVATEFGHPGVPQTLP